MNTSLGNNPFNWDCTSFQIQDLHWCFDMWFPEFCYFVDISYIFIWIKVTPCDASLLYNMPFGCMTSLSLIFPKGFSIKIPIISVFIPGFLDFLFSTVGWMLPLLSIKIFFFVYFLLCPFHGLWAVSLAITYLVTLLVW